MRPTELKNLDWGDIGEREFEVGKDKQANAIIIQARGKAKERELVAMPETLTYFNLLRQLFLLQVEREPTDNDPVFSDRNGGRIGSFKKGLSELLKAAGLRQTSDGRLRDSGSFRPFYISQQIREGVHPHMLIRNTGTSSKMVISNYNKIQPTEEIPKLTPDWFKRRPFGSKK